MTKWQIVLLIRRGGSSVGTTDDVVEAASPVEAERLAMAAWREARPGCSFAPLLTIQRKETD